MSELPVPWGCLGYLQYAAEAGVASASIARMVIAVFISDCSFPGMSLQCSVEAIIPHIYELTSRHILNWYYL